jgi:NAD(P)-dependent dehydrogenase (short-subunit alcohol dehydrogenase family)
MRETKMNDELRVFDGAVAIVTGGASGIGEQFAASLASRGARVTIADLDEELGARVAERLRSEGGDVHARAVDVSDHRAVKDLVQAVVGEHGRIDYMLNLAGILYAGEALDHTIEEWNRVLDVNIRGVVNGVESVYPIMVDQGFGHIVNMSSTAGFVPFYNVPYTASRFAVVGMTLALRDVGFLDGVRVNLL